MKHSEKIKNMIKNNLKLIKSLKQKKIIIIWYLKSYSHIKIYQKNTK